MSSPRSFSAWRIPARPLRTAVPRRSRSSDEGGVWIVASTSSDRVRRRRSIWGVLAGVTAARRGRSVDLRPDFWRLTERLTGRFGLTVFLAVFFGRFAVFLLRLAARFAIREPFQNLD